MPFHVVAGDRVGDALIAERRHNPVEQLWRVVVFDDAQDAVLDQFVAPVIDKRRTARQAADRMNQSHGVGLPAAAPGQSPGLLWHSSRGWFPGRPHQISATSWR